MNTISRILFFTLLFCAGFVSAQTHSLMPVPQQISFTGSRFAVGQGFHVVMTDTSGSRATRAAIRFLQRLDNRTAILLPKKPFSKPLTGKGPYLVVTYKRVGELRVQEDESYTLTVTGDHARLEAETDLGILHGLETFLQLIETDQQGYFIPGVTITDAPRFTWRGLMIDVGRHFQPVDVIKRNLDGMAMVKLNVLHLHLSEDQGFRIESKKFPKLHLMGSNGEYFTQEQIRDIITYATDRGIRVVPEFDMPGHASSWFVGHPELASGKGPYAIEKKFGVFDPTMDPTKKSTYKFLKVFLTEMCKLFPDAYFHIGGDENEGKEWNANKDIQEFKKKNNLKDNHELQNYFNIKVQAILKKNGKRMIGWDEILQPGLPSDAVVHSWRGKEGLEAAAKQGHDVILSNGYYIDLSQPAWKHYQNDPLPAASTSLSEKEKKHVLGGEATMWSELVTPATIDSRIWPRTAAIAERLWSPENINDVADMYRRLAAVSFELESVGLKHISYRPALLRQHTGHSNTKAMEELLGLIEPLKDYNRGQQGIPYSTDLPLTRLPDMAAPDARAAAAFKSNVERLIMKRDTSAIPLIQRQLEDWSRLPEKVNSEAGDVPALRGLLQMAARLKTVSLIGLESLVYLKHPNDILTAWVSESYEKLRIAAKPVEESELMVVEPIMQLFQHVQPK